MVRASSPPDAALASGQGRLARVGPSSKVDLVAAGPSPRRAMSNRADGMARSCRVASISDGQQRGGRPPGPAPPRPPRRPARPGPGAISASRAGARRLAPRPGGQAGPGRRRRRPAPRRACPRTCGAARGGAGGGPGPPRGGRGRPPRSRPPSRSSAARSASVGHEPPHPAVQRLERGPAGQGAGRLGQPVDGAGAARSAVRPGERRQGGGGRRAVGRRLGQPLLLGLQPRVLVGVRRWPAPSISSIW